jgi:hypothetical protein
MSHPYGEHETFVARDDALNAIEFVLSFSTCSIATSIFANARSADAAHVPKIGPRNCYDEGLQRSYDVLSSNGDRARWS